MTTEVDSEAGWLLWAARHGVPAAALGSRAGVRPGLLPCYEVMNAAPGAIPGLTVALGQLQAWLHGRPTADAPGPTVEWQDALDRLAGAVAAADPEVDVDLVGRLLARLSAVDPGPLSPVACHGDFTPVTVHLDPDDHRDIVVTGWGDAVLSDREYDVAFSELGLWASAYLTPDPERRTLMKVARGFLLNGYRAGYAAVAGAPDPGRRRLWGAYHVCRLLAGPLLAGPPFRSWDPTVAAATVTAFRTDLAARFDDLLPDHDLPSVSREDLP